METSGRPFFYCGGILVYALRQENDLSEWGEGVWLFQKTVVS